MNEFQRLILALAIVLVDWAVFFLPLAALFVAYVIVVNPPWVRSFLDASARSSDDGGNGGG
jgi:hypothetical protein